jgi:hypothetical protein
MFRYAQVVGKIFPPTMLGKSIGIEKNQKDSSALNLKKLA